MLNYLENMQKKKDPQNPKQKQNKKAHLFIQHLLIVVLNTSYRQMHT